MNHLIIAFSFNLAIATSLVAGVDFNKEIRPILSDKCFQCHGPDAKNQKSDYRLDTQEHSRAMIEGVAGITPGSPEKSRVHLRIHATDQDEVMPPPDLGRPLSPQEINLLDQWIKEGAAYDEHWAFKLPVRPKVPAVPSDWSDRVRNPIDSFVFARLDADKLRPAAEADPETCFAEPPCWRRACSPARPPSGPFWPMENQALMSARSMRCWVRWTMRRGRPCSGWMPHVMPTLTGTKTTTNGATGHGGTGSFRPSIKTCPSTNSRSNNWPGTCCPMPHRRRFWPRPLTATIGKTRKEGPWLRSSLSKT
jgi:hypothetical protein